MVRITARCKHSCSLDAKSTVCFSFPLCSAWPFTGPWSTPVVDYPSLASSYSRAQAGKLNAPVPNTRALPPSSLTDQQHRHVLNKTFQKARHHRSSPLPGATCAVKKDRRRGLIKKKKKERNKRREDLVSDLIRRLSVTSNCLFCSPQSNPLSANSKSKFSEPVPLTQQPRAAYSMAYAFWSSLPERPGSPSNTRQWTSSAPKSSKTRR